MSKPFYGRSQVTQVDVNSLDNFQAQFLRSVAILYGFPDNQKEHLAKNSRKLNSSLRQKRVTGPK